jgi:hypothetical protein
VTDLKEELWRLAFIVAMTRVGLLALERNEDGAYLPPTAAVKADPEGTRKARRKYRKLWRMDLARSLKEFGNAPKRRQKRMRWHGVTINGQWKSVEDPFEGRLLEIKACEVGRRPRRGARAQRWIRVKQCPELRVELLKVAAEFGLLDPKRSM